MYGVRRAAQLLHERCMMRAWSRWCVRAPCVGTRTMPCSRALCTASTGRRKKEAPRGLGYYISRIGDMTDSDKVHQVYSSIPQHLQPNIRLFSVLFPRCKERPDKIAFYMKEMRRLDIVPDLQCYTSIVRALKGRDKELASVWRSIKKRALAVDEKLAVEMLRSVGSLQNAWSVCKELMVEHNMPLTENLFNAFMTFDRADQWKDGDKVEIAREVAEELRAVDFLPKESSISSIVLGLGDHFEESWSFLSQWLVRGHAVYGVYPLNVLLKRAVLCGRNDIALDVFHFCTENMEPNYYTWRCMMNMHERDAARALALLEDMKRTGYCIDERTTVDFLHSLAPGRPHVARMIIERVVDEEGIECTALTFNAAMAVVQSKEFANEMLMEMQRRGIRPDGETFAAALVASEKDPMGTHDVIVHMETEGVQATPEMLAMMLKRSSSFECQMKHVEEMRRQGVKITNKATQELLKGCTVVEAERRLTILAAHVGNDKHAVLRGVKAVTMMDENVANEILIQAQRRKAAGDDWYSDGQFH